MMELGRHVLHCGDCLAVMATLEPESVDAVVTDPPYGLGFMGKAWDALPPGRDWADACLRVLKPGGHLVAFGGQRTIHRLTCALEDAGWEIRDQIQWVTWQGFPKSLDVSRAIDDAAGAVREVVGRHSGVPGLTAASGWNDGPFTRGEVGTITAPATPEARQWSGWGTALKPAAEPAVLARKPLDGTVAANVLKWGTGGLNLDACRYRPGDMAWPGPGDEVGSYPKGPGGNTYTVGAGPDGTRGKPCDGHPNGRFPANVYHCPKASTAEREAGCEALRQRSAGELTGGRAEGSAGLDCPRTGAGRSSHGRGNHHPTVKPLALMRWLVRLVTPPGGLVLEPFAGSGTTLLACEAERVRCLAIEREPDYCEIIRARWMASTRQRGLEL